MTENVKVFCRVRPMSKAEEGTGECVHVHPSERTVTLQMPDTGAAHAFTFAKIFNPYATQRDVYEESAKDIVRDVLMGMNAAVIGYGQTGSGKTHTMIGPHHLYAGRRRGGASAFLEREEEIGIIPRVCQDLFGEVQRQTCGDVRFEVHASFFELYCEKVLDLLSPEREKMTGDIALYAARSGLEVWQDRDQGLLVRGAVSVPVQSTEDVLDILERGGQARVMAATRSNEYSSRSHALFLLTIVKYDAITMRTYHSQFYLVDLAGSERAEKIDPEGRRFIEGRHINTSLFALSNVICALTSAPPSSPGSSTPGNRSARAHVPYRDSKLTRMLQNAFGGNGKSIIICNLSPSTKNAGESLSTLRFADRSQRIQNDVSANVVARSAEELEILLEKAEREIASLKFQLRRATRDLSLLSNSSNVPTQPARAEGGASFLAPGSSTLDSDDPRFRVDSERRTTSAPLTQGLQLLPHREVGAYIPDKLWCCPITRTTFEDPVLAMDGMTYERRAILAHFEKFGLTSPSTGEALSSALLMENIMVRRALAFVPRREQPLGVLDDCTSEAIPPIMSLPVEILLYVFSYLDGYELASCAMVCTEWRAVISDDRLWERCLMNEFPGEAAPDPFRALEDERPLSLSFRVQYRELFLRLMRSKSSASFSAPAQLPGVKLYSNKPRRLPRLPTKIR